MDYLGFSSGTGSPFLNFSPRFTDSHLVSPSPPVSALIVLHLDASKAHTGRGSALLGKTAQ